MLRCKAAFTNIQSIEFLKFFGSLSTDVFGNKHGARACKFGMFSARRLPRVPHRIEGLLNEFVCTSAIG